MIIYFSILRFVKPEEEAMGSELTVMMTERPAIIGTGDEMDERIYPLTLLRSCVTTSGVGGASRHSTAASCHPARGGELGDLRPPSRADRSRRRLLERPGPARDPGGPGRAIWSATALSGRCRRRKFPLLVKLLDANQDLSVQVHPDDEYALEHEGGELGKTEMWYVLACRARRGDHPGSKTGHDTALSSAMR